MAFSKFKTVKINSVAISSRLRPFFQPIDWTIKAVVFHISVCGIRIERKKVTVAGAVRIHVLNEILDASTLKGKKHAGLNSTYLISRSMSI